MKPIRLIILTILNLAMSSLACGQPNTHDILKKLDVDFHPPPCVSELSNLESAFETSYDMVTRTIITPNLEALSSLPASTKNYKSRRWLFGPKGVVKKYEYRTAKFEGGAGSFTLQSHYINPEGKVTTIVQKDTSAALGMLKQQFNYKYGTEGNLTSVHYYHSEKLVATITFKMEEGHCQQIYVLDSNKVQKRVGVRWLDKQGRAIKEELYSDAYLSLPFSTSEFDFNFHSYTTRKYDRYGMAEISDGLWSGDIHIDSTREWFTYSGKNSLKEIGSHHISYKHEPNSSIMSVFHTSIYVTSYTEHNECGNPITAALQHGSDYGIDAIPQPSPDGRLEWYYETDLKGHPAKSYEVKYYESGKIEAITRSDYTLDFAD